MLYKLVKDFKRKKAKAKILAKTKAKENKVVFSYVFKVEDIHDKTKHWF